MLKIKRKTKKKLLRIRIIMCKSFKKTMENIGAPIAKRNGLI